MTYTVQISHEALIEALEEKLGGIFEHIKDGDKIESIRLGYTQVYITIGEGGGT